MQEILYKPQKSVLVHSPLIRNQMSFDFVLSCATLVVFGWPGIYFHNSFWSNHVDKVCPLDTPHTSKEGLYYIFLLFWIIHLFDILYAEAPILQPPDEKGSFIGKDPDAGKDCRREKGTTEDEMVGWHHRRNGHWVWVSSGSWWKTGRPGVLQSTGLPEVGHDCVTEHQ